MQIPYQQVSVQEKDYGLLHAEGYPWIWTYYIKDRWELYYIAYVRMK